jgi:YbbR domain-containing protein
VRFLRQNLGLKLLALFLALCAWSIVRLTAAPTGETPAQRVFFKPLQVTPPEDPDLVYKVGQQEVVITLRGRRTVLEKIEPGQISVDVDLSKRVAGDYMAKVDVLAPGGAEISDVHPTHVWVQITRSEAAFKPVRVQLLGRPAEGTHVGTPAAEPRSVRITGPPGNVDEVQAVVAPVNLAGLDRTFSTRARALEAVDANGRAIESVEIQSEGVDITVPIEVVHEARVQTDRVTVRRAPGWTYVISADPPKVTLEGPAGSEMPDVVHTEPWIVQHATRSQSRELRLVLPEGLRVAGEARVLVSVLPTRTSSPAP